MAQDFESALREILGDSWNKLTQFQGDQVKRLTNLLEGAGFKVRRVSWNRSKEEALRWLDLRDFGLNLFLEAVK